jgi:hypothetical protein
MAKLFTYFCVIMHINKCEMIQTVGDTDVEKANYGL